MASPVVAGTVALMLQANPNLTPNLVKAILQYTAQEYRGYNALTQGAGFLNTKGAVELARFFKTAQPGQRYPSSSAWSKKLLWGNHRISKGVIKPNAPAWKLGVVWGAAKDVAGANIVWGTYCADECDNVVWGTVDSLANYAWATASTSRATSSGAPYAVRPDTDGESDNIVWGTDVRRRATTSCGAPTAAGPTATTSSGARPDGALQEATTSCGAPWRRKTTSCGAPTVRRQRRVGHVERRRRRQPDLGQLGRGRAAVRRPGR